MPRAFADPQLSQEGTNFIVHMFDFTYLTDRRQVTARRE